MEKYSNTPWNCALQYNIAKQYVSDHIFTAEDYIFGV